MFTLLNILALLVMLAVAYVGWLQGLHRAAVSLVACVLAGVIAFGCFGPASALLSSDSPRTTWYYAADALCLWAIFCVAFLGLRTLAHLVFRQEAPFGYYPSRIGGLLLGLVVGYLVAGFCLVVIQMLPMSPAIMGAYAPFRYERAPDRAERGNRLWLQWDRGTLGFFGYLSRPLGFEKRGLFDRYGDVYRDPAAVTADVLAHDAADVPDVDDFLYYHWYRRWEFVRWRTGVAQGPVPAGLARGYRVTMNGIRAEVGRVDALSQIPNFPQVRLGDDEQFLLLEVSFAPSDGGAAEIDSDRFVLLGPEHRDRFTRPKVYGPARLQGDEPQIVSLRDNVVGSVDLRFNTKGRKYLMAGGRFAFKPKDGDDRRSLIFIIPKAYQASDLRLVIDPPPQPKPAGAP